jgi:hypothetical protein
VLAALQEGRSGIVRMTEAQQIALENNERAFFDGVWAPDDV